MSSLVSGHHKFCQEICEALGLKHVRKLDLHMAFDEIVTVTIQFYPEEEGVKKLVPVLKKYNLIETKEEALNSKEQAPSTSLEERWLAETSIAGKAWYVQEIIAASVVLGTANAWCAKRFETKEKCQEWIDNTKPFVGELDNYAPVSHGFAIEREEK